MQIIDYTIGAPSFKQGKKYNICYKAFQAVYLISSYKRRKLLFEVKNGIKNSDAALTDWRKVHDSTLQRIKTSLKNDANDIGFAAKQIITNIICPQSPKTYKVCIHVINCDLKTTII